MSNKIAKAVEIPGRDKFPIGMRPQFDELFSIGNQYRSTPDQIRDEVFYQFEEACRAVRGCIMQAVNFASTDSSMSKDWLWQSDRALRFLIAEFRNGNNKALVVKLESLSEFLSVYLPKRKAAEG